jgi:tetratricopeptide (TPR) repeat protein
VSPTRVIAIALVGLVAACFQLPPGIDELNAGADALMQGKKEEALRHYDDAIKARPEWATAHCSRGNALVQLKRYEEGIASYRRCLVLNPADDNGKVALAEALVRACRYSEAHIALKRLDDARSSDARILHNGEWVRRQLEKAAQLGGRCLPDDEG